MRLWRNDFFCFVFGMFLLRYPSAVFSQLYRNNLDSYWHRYISRVTELAKTTIFFLYEYKKSFWNVPIIVLINFHHWKLTSFLSGIEPIDKVATSIEHRSVYNVSKIFLSLIFKLTRFFTSLTLKMFFFQHVPYLSSTRNATSSTLISCKT